jgi:hypothetical protein
MGNFKGRQADRAATYILKIWAKIVKVSAKYGTAKRIITYSLRAYTNIMA